MRISTKLSTAVHILLMMAVLPPGEKTTSDELACSVGRNPVEIRKIFAGLKKAGIIDISRGSGGGRLNRAPGDISLCNIYEAVETTPLTQIIGIHERASDECYIGRNIHAVLDEPYAEIGDAIRHSMQGITLQTLLGRLAALDPEAKVSLEEAGLG